jgi:hypothetical protein
MGGGTSGPRNFRSVIGRRSRARRAASNLKPAVTAFSHSRSARLRASRPDFGSDAFMAQATARPTLRACRPAARAIVLRPAGTATASVSSRMVKQSTSGEPSPPAARKARASARASSKVSARPAAGPQSGSLQVRNVDADLPTTWAASSHPIRSAMRVSASSNERGGRSLVTRRDRKKRPRRRTRGV